MKKILIIEDSAHILTKLSIALKLEGENYEVRYTKNGRWGLNMARKIQPDLILLDIMLPGLNGIEICRALKSDEKYMSIPIILMTALDKSEEIIKGLSAGANDYVSKPFKIQEIMARVKTHLRVKEIYDSKNKVELKACVKAEAELKNRERFFQTTLQSLGEGILVLDRKFRIQMANRFLLKMIKREEKEAVGELCYKLIHRREERCVDCPAAETFETGKPAFGKHTGIAKDGSTTYVDLAFYPIFDAEGRVVQVVEKAIDMLEHRKTEALLRRMHRSIESADHSIMMTDINGLIHYVNPAFFKMTGYSKEEVLGSSARLLKSGLQQEKFYDDMWDIILSGEVWRGQIKNRRKDGTIFYAMLVIAPVVGIEKKIEGFVAIQHDITEQKRVEKEKEKIYAQLLHSQKLEVVGQLAGGIAHEFNNITMALMGYGEVIHAGMHENDPLRSKVKQIIHLSKKAANFTGSLLAFSRKQIMNPATVRLDKIVENIRKLVVIILGEDIEFITEHSDIDLSIKADSGMIEQVLMNLITNSKDAMPGGGRITAQTRMVEIGEEFIKKEGFGKCGDYALLSFTDTGKGMDKKTAKKAFEPFFTTKEAGKGTGLGLSTVYGIVKQHNGYVHIESETGRGTTFRIYFPMVNVGDNNTVVEEKTCLPSGGTETILLAEDNEDIRMLMKDELIRFGYRVLTAVDGEEAVKIFKKNKDEIKLLLLDLVMPKKNGQIVYKEIAQKKPDVKSIFMTGYSRDVLDNQMIVSENVKYFSKPKPIYQLLMSIRETLDKK